MKASASRAYSGRENKAPLLRQAATKSKLTTTLIPKQPSPFRRVLVVYHITSLFCPLLDSSQLLDTISFISYIQAFTLPFVSGPCMHASSRSIAVAKPYRLSGLFLIFISFEV